MKVKHHSECKHSSNTNDEHYRYSIDSPAIVGHNNCVLCLIEFYGRPLSQAEVAEILGISKMRVSQIERVALKKFRRRFGMKFGKNILLD